MRRRPSTEAHLNLAPSCFRSAAEFCQASIYTNTRRRVQLRRTVSGRSSEKDCSTKFGPSVVASHVPDPTPDDERCCLPCLFRQALADPWHQQARGPGSARLQALSVSPGDDPEPLALVRL